MKYKTLFHYFVFFYEFLNIYKKNGTFNRFQEKSSRFFYDKKIVYMLLCNFVDEVTSTLYITLYSFIHTKILL